MYHYNTIQCYTNQVRKYNCSCSYSRLGLRQDRCDHPQDLGLGLPEKDQRARFDVFGMADKLEYHLGAVACTYQARRMVEREDLDRLLIPQLRSNNGSQYLPVQVRNASWLGSSAELCWRDEGP
jgi:hypothetical protein